MQDILTRQATQAVKVQNFLFQTQEFFRAGKFLSAWKHFVFLHVVKDIPCTTIIIINHTIFAHWRVVSL